MLTNIYFIVLISVIALPLLVVIFSTLRALVIFKTDIIEVRDLILKIALAIYVHIIFFLFSFFQIFRISASLNREEPYLVAFFISVSIFPTLSIIFNYFNINRYLTKKFSLTKKAKFPIKEKEQLEIYVKRISEILNLKSTPKVLLSEQKNIPPFVFGKSSKKSFIAFPVNWDEILKRISRGDEKVEKSIREFIITHELSHIKHRDHVFVSTSYSFLKSFKYWIIGMISLIIFYLSVVSSEVPYSLYTIMQFGLVYYLISFFLTMSVSRNREFAADSRSSLVLSENELGLMFALMAEIKERKESYFEYMLDWFSIFPKVKGNIVGISASQVSSGNFVKEKLKKIGNTRLRDRISKLVDYILSTHPNGRDRQKKLQESRSDKPRYDTVSMETAVWMGVIFAFLKNTFLFFPNELILENQSIKFNIESLVLVFITLVTAMLFLFFLAGSPDNIPSFRSRIAYLTKRYLIIYVAFFLTTILLSFLIGLLRGIFIVANKEFMRWLLSQLEMTFVLFLASLFITNFFVSVYSANIDIMTTSRIKVQKRYVVLSVFATVILFLFAFFMLQLKLNLWSIFFGVLIGITAITSIYELCPLLNFESFLVWGFKDFSIKLDTRMSPFASMFAGIVLLGALTFILSTSVNDMAVKNPEIFSYIIYALVGVVFIQIVISTKKKQRPSYLDVTSYLSNINGYLYILKGLGRTQFLEDNGESIRKKIGSYILDDNSFTISRSINLGSCFTSYCALCSLSYLGSDMDHKKSAEWFLSLENETGGFAPIAGLKSRLSCTYSALYILDKFKMLESVKNLKIHMEWVKSLQTGSGFFSSPLSKGPKVEQTYLALSSLLILGDLDGINKKACSDWLHQSWEEDSNDPLTIFYSIKGRELLGEPTEELKRKVRDDWLIPTSSYWKKLKIDKNLLYFYNCFRVAEIVMDGPADIEKLIPGLGEKVYNGLSYYLEKR